MCVCVGNFFGGEKKNQCKVKVLSFLFFPIFIMHRQGSVAVIKINHLCFNFIFIIFIVHHGEKNF